MNKNKQTFLTGILALMFSQALVKILGLVYRVYLTNKENFGDKGNAILSGAFGIYILFLTISSIGAPSAISKLVSEKIAVGNFTGAHRVFKVGILFFGFLGLVGSLVMAIGARYISNVIIQMPEATLSLIILSPSIFFISISSVIKGYFMGNSNMNVTAKSQILEQFFKAMFTIIFVAFSFKIYNKDTILMATFANLATTFSVFINFIYLYIYYNKNKKQLWKNLNLGKNNKQERKRIIIKSIIIVAFPLIISSFLMSITRSIDLITVIRGLKTFLTDEQAKIQYGMLTGKIDTLISLPLSFNIAIATALIPAISSNIANKNYKNMNKKINFSLILTFIIGFFSTIAILIFAQPILKLLFPTQYEGAQIFKISSLSIIFITLLQTNTSILQAMGKAKIVVIALSVGVVFKTAINIFLIPIPEIGIKGAPIGSIACYFIAFIITFFGMRKYKKELLK